MYKLYLFDEYDQLSENFIVRALQFLPESRRVRALRYRRTIDRWNCVITYLMLQYGLRECFDITSFKIAFGEYGKPYLPEYPHVHFNISHCDAGCAVVVADCPVGVDIQDIRPFSWDAAKLVCCEQELAELEGCADRDKLFTEMWATKESYVKMTGTGIAYGMNDSVKEYRPSMGIAAAGRHQSQNIGQLTRSNTAAAASILGAEYLTSNCSPVAMTKPFKQVKKSRRKNHYEEKAVIYCVSTYSVPELNCSSISF